MKPFRWRGFLSLEFLARPFCWALTEPEQQICPKCGTRLEIDLGKGERPIHRTPQDSKPC
ncbi:MAG: hypothetical protein CO103_03545 [Chloroflexi bacterium CG_4_9_14_3_um_filter_45_9]|nr:MAG: hypothetical protein AUK00_05705 [Dehalococcoidia bacterium CG2_30_46_9]PIU23562.1 MAG: hypothetical protein COT13_02375 [Chloroflexi bacterium CG08_land_8_20_14_0_20_45_12]PIX27419.1 MAG: hypothetical protein COZ67_02395 [Chloroflexi bacterium CG_4_8_14_3_um_filter_45_15]PJB50036.1 MAG: hypothetical protein CO103_03545 [Chloroflexi bacterium CG_4_9_14_3_um_filter_45_9]